MTKKAPFLVILSEVEGPQFHFGRPERSRRIVNRKLVVSEVEPSQNNQ